MTSLLSNSNKFIINKDYVKSFLKLADSRGNKAWKNLIDLRYIQKEKNQGGVHWKIREYPEDNPDFMKEHKTSITRTSAIKSDDCMTSESTSLENGNSKSVKYTSSDFNPIEITSLENDDVSSKKREQVY